MRLATLDLMVVPSVMTYSIEQSFEHSQKNMDSLVSFDDDTSLMFTNELMRCGEILGQIPGTNQVDVRVERAQLRGGRRYNSLDFTMDKTSRELMLDIKTFCYGDVEDGKPTGVEVTRGRFCKMATTKEKGNFPRKRIFVSMYSGENVTVIVHPPAALGPRQVYVCLWDGKVLTTTSPE